jgi:hypothetical protein
MQQITVNRKGEAINFVSPYSDVEAQVLIRKLVDNGALGWSNFAKDLANSQRPLSGKQIAWVHKLIFDFEEKQNPGSSKKEEPKAAMQVPQIRKMLDAAAETLKNPKVNLETPGGQRVRLKMAGPGRIWITDGAPFEEQVTFGYILPNANLFWTGDIVASVSALLLSFEADPKAVATAYGQRTSNCCFCGRDLSTGESVAVGYGPICAEKFGLPWGDERVSSTVELKKQIDELERMAGDSAE